MFSDTTIEHLKFGQSPRPHLKDVEGLPFRLSIDTKGGLYFPVEEGMTYLNVGCGFHKLEGYTNVDNIPQFEPDLLCDINDLECYIQPSSMDRIMLKHIIPCLTHHQAVVLMENCYKFLKPGGRMFIQYPDLYSIALELIKRGPHDLTFVYVANGGLVGYDQTIDELGEDYYQLKFCWTEQLLLQELTRIGYDKDTMQRVVPMVGATWRDKIFIVQRPEEDRHD